MLRFIAVPIAGMLAACSSQAAPGTAGSGTAGSGTAAAGAGSASQAQAQPARPKPASVMEQVRQWAPVNMRVAPAELTVPGVELFALTEAAPGADDEVAPVKLVGVTGGLGGRIVEGRELVRAAIEGKPDRMTLARVALTVAGDDGEVLTAPKTREHKKARVGPPSVVRNALGFWVWTTDMPRTLEHGKLDLTSGVLQVEPAPVPHEVMINNAMTTLGSVSVLRHVVAIRTLAAACEEARPRQALMSALGSHPRAKTRAAIADEAHRCGAAAVDPLISAMQHDASGLVRRQAAAALGRIGDARARPALAKAARGDDADLAWNASNALRKIP